MQGRYGKSYCGGKVHHSDFNDCAKYHLHCVIINFKSKVALQATYMYTYLVGQRKICILATRARKGGIVKAIVMETVFITSTMILLNRMFTVALRP